MDKTMLAKDFELLVFSPEGLWDASIPIAAARAGAVGLLNLTYLGDVSKVIPQVERLMQLARGRYGLVLHGRLGAVEQAALETLRGADTVLLTCETGPELAEMVSRCRTVANRVGLIVTSEEEARLATQLGCDLVVAKGNEAGGRVGGETTFILLQRLLTRIDLPVFAWGGVGLATAAACRVAGAAGVVLDWQLALSRESTLTAPLRRRLAMMDGSETVIVRAPEGHAFRLYAQVGMSAKDELQALSEKPLEETTTDTQAWDRMIGTMMAAANPEARLWATGQDAAFAAPIFARANTVARMLGLFRESITQAVEGCTKAETLKAGSPLAKSHGTTFPVVQGPMTRVSDSPEFCEAVADGGGLPFLALALMRQAQVRDLLERTRTRMGTKPWGVGILGFVERELRAEQMAVVEEIRPPFAIIAGGRPDQAASLEARGIATYLHVPSPGMLETFVREGARRFIFEGRECGGHVGPRSSFVLWETMVRVLLQAELSETEAAKVHVLFAGGINDALSGAMVSALAQPLVQRGMKVGVLLGTAYLFTEEIVRTGAILEGFQQVALETEQTALVETGPGHAIRCAPTPFVQTFEEEKRRLKREARPAEEIREELEQMNLGRLRVAAKGVTRVANPEPGQSPYVSIDDTHQRREGMYMIGQVAALRKSRCTIRGLHEEVCAGAVDRLRALQGQDLVPAVPAEPAPPPLDIAIVGMSCLLPGANTIDELWHNILAKRDLVGEVPAERFDAGLWFDAERKARDKIYSKWGGFLNAIPFDPLKYGIPPTALASIEPGQLLALELVDRALRDAGYADHNPHKARTSVIFGMSGGFGELGQKYIFRALLPQFLDNPDEALWQQLPEWTEDSFAGILGNIISGRICNRFDFGGANFTVDAACASSLAALHLACRTLADKSSDLAITGGCDLVQNAFGFLCFAKSGALSPRGKSRAFDASADGIAISEGLASVVLKRLDDAERDGDRIYAVIRAVAAGSDGRSKGMTAPRIEGQLRTLQRAYAQAGFSPATVSLFEAHGTGTALGDATECQALKAVLEQQGAPSQTSAIGSVKSMIGHTKTAAGVTGLIKTALALHHRVLPPTMHVDQPNPKAGLTEGPLYVNTELRPWIRGDNPRRAAISSFGFGGTNFHAVLEEYQGQALPWRKEMPHSRWPAELFLFAAKSPADLAGRVRGFAAEVRQAVEAGAQMELADLAFTLHRRQTPAGAAHRLAVVAGSASELVEQLQASADQLAPKSGTKLPAGVYYTDQPLGAGTPLTFLFPGQGAQYPNMLRDLAIEFTEVADSFEKADATVGKWQDRRLSQLIFPTPAFSDQERTAQAEALKATDVAQPALGVCGLGLWRLLASFGVKPMRTGGHSYGELVALCAAASLNEDSLYQLSRARGDAIVATTRDGGATDLGTMLAVQGDKETVQKAIKDCPDVWVANHNSPKQTVISGTKPGIARAAEMLTAARLANTPLQVACAFHSPLMAPARQRFEQALAKTEFQPPVLPVYSNITAAAYPADPAQIRGLLSEQLVNGVEFVAEIEAMHAAGARVFVELGPSNVVSRMVDQILGNRPHVAVSLQSRERHGLTQFLHALAILSAHGVAIDPERLYEGRTVKILDLRSPAALAKPKLAPHLWLVDGGNAWPASKPRPLPATPLALSPKIEETAPMNLDHAPSPMMNGHNSHVHAAPAAAEAVSVRTDADDTIGQFQETMRRFLETQQRVMEAYLTGTPAQVAPAPISASVPVETPTRAMVPPVEPKEVIRPAAPVSAKVPAPVAAPAPQPEPVGSLSDRLIEIACERTGYPAEMLSLDANLEADLGIDSIKRVEIIGAFRRAALPALTEPPAWFMERMTAAKTLRGILEGVTELAGGSAKPAPAKAPIPAAPVVEENLEELLIKVACERTGYPAEMLKLDANLEADLGIDSIKRVEIIGAFRRAALPALTEPPAAFMEEMTAAKTLGAILGGVSRLRGGDKVQPVKQTLAPIAHQEPPTAPAIERAPRCVGAAVEIPLLENVPVQVPREVVILTDEGRGIASAVARAIEAQGGRACLLALSDLASRESTVQAVARTRQAHGSIGGVLHLLPMREAPRFPGLEEKEWNRYADPELKGMLYLLQAIAPELSAAQERPIHVACASIGGGDFGDTGELEAAHPWRGGLAGILKTAAKEWEHAHFRAIDVDEIPEAAELLREFLAAGPVEVGYRWGRRLTIQAMREELPSKAPAKPAVALNSDSVVLVTGGAQGITSEVARELATRTKATLILLGRLAAPAPEEDAATANLEEGVQLRQQVLNQMRQAGETVSPKVIEAKVQSLLKARAIRQTLADLRAAGSRVEYIACDVRDTHALETIITDVQRRHGKINALLHGAGVIEDRSILDKTSESFDRVVQTKVYPLLVLARLLVPEQLQMVMLFSSVSGFFGSPGQVDYAAGNEVLNRMARRLKNLWPGKVVALNWGPWSGTGMVTPEVARRFISRGVELVTVPAGRSAAWQELLHRGSTDVRVLIWPGTWVKEADRLATELATAPVHTPLLVGQRVRRLPGAVIEARVVLDPARQIFLHDHRIDGKPVLPLTVALELMAEAAAAAKPDWHVSHVRDLRLFCGVVLEKKRREIALRAEPLEQGPDGGEWRVRITDPRQPQRPLYEALVRLAAQMPVAPTAPPLTPIDPTLQLDAPLAYQRWLFHGPAFHVIEDGQGLASDGIDVTVRAGAHGGRNWLIDPLVLDAAPQLAWLWSRAMHGTSALPNRIGTYHRYGPMGTGPVQTLFRVNPGSDGQTIKATIWFVRDGKVVGQMEGLESTANAQLNRVVGTSQR